MPKCNIEIAIVFVLTISIVIAMLGYIFPTPFLYVTSLFLLLLLILFLLPLLPRKAKQRVKSLPELIKPVKFTLIIPTYKEIRLVEKTLIYLIKNNYPKEYTDIIVVSKSSKEDQKEFAQLQKNVERYNFIRILTHFGSKAEAINYALEKVKTDWVGLLDADSFVEKNYLSIAAKYIQYFNKHDIKGFVGSYFIGNRKNNLITSLLSLDMFQIREPLNMIGSCLSQANFHGYNGFFRTDMLKFLKFEKLHPSEDIELSTRLASRGIKILPADELVANYNAAKSLRALASTNKMV